MLLTCVSAARSKVSATNQGPVFLIAVWIYISELRCNICFFYFFSFFLSLRNWGLNLFPLGIRCLDKSITRCVFKCRNLNLLLLLLPVCFVVKVQKGRKQKRGAGYPQSLGVLVSRQLVQHVRHRSKDLRGCWEWGVQVAELLQELDAGADARHSATTTTTANQLESTLCSLLELLVPAWVHDDVSVRWIYPALNAKWA